LNITTTGTISEAGTLLTSKYLQLAGGTMTANANITLSGTGTFTGIHSGNGAALTNLPLSAYSTTGTDANYVLKTGSTMTGLLSGTTINTTGNIGIGINNPNSALHMKGDISFTEPGYETVRIHTISHSHSNGSSVNNSISFLRSFVNKIIF
jgi:hypothetical protein